MKIRAVGAKLFHAQGRTDRKGGKQGGKQGAGMTKLIAAFRNFADEPNTTVNVQKATVFTMRLIAD
jgi:hypothetical protein